MSEQPMIVKIPAELRVLRVRPEKRRLKVLAEDRTARVPMEKT